MTKNKRAGAEMMQRNKGASVAFDRMLRSGNFNSVIVHIEGNSDIAFYRWFIDEKVVQLQQNDGKSAAMAAAAEATKRKIKGIVAIVDSDFDHILNNGPDENVIRTDTHDIETLMLREDLFRISEANYIDKRKKEYESYTQDEIWTDIIEIATKMGKLRLLSLENNYNLNFKNVEPLLDKEDIISCDGGKIVFDLSQYIYQCVNQTDNCSITVKDLKTVFNNDARKFDTWQICRGHDISNIISIVYSPKCLGWRNVTRNEIENLISSTYIVSRKFKKTTMYQDIKDWQNQNLGWKILSNELL